MNDSTRCPANPASVKTATVSSRFVPARGGLLQRKCACGGKAGADGECEECRKQKLQRRAESLAPTEGSLQAPPIVHGVLHSPGRPLEAATRNFMEPRLGHDFGHVRIHTDTQAAQSAQAVGAQAYTVGRDVVFAAGSYQPHTTAGRSLISHELVHVIQQGGTLHRGDHLQIGEVHSAAEREADNAAQRVENGSPVQVTGSSAPRLQGKWDWKRFGKGFLIGGIIPGAIATGFLGPLGLLVGVGTGLIGGVIGALTGGEEKQQPNKQPQQKQPPTVPTVAGCTEQMDGMIGKGIEAGLGLLGTVIPAVTGLDPKSPANTTSQRAATALKKFFKSDDARVVNHVTIRLQQIQAFMTALSAKRAAFQPGNQAKDVVPPTECHTEKNDEECGRGIAYVPAVRSGQTEREGMVFCPRFFRTDPPTGKDEDRGAAIIHEAAHSLVGGEHIGDRAYLHLRFAPDLTTEEALTNADSYRGFVQEVAGKEQTVGHIYQDIVEGCDDVGAAKLNQAFRRIQQWFSVAERVVHDERPEWRALEYWVDLRKKYLGGTDQALVDAAAKAFDKVSLEFVLSVFARCHSKNDATCPPGKATASASRPSATELQVCPDWLQEPDADRRAVLVLAEMLGYSGVRDPQARMNHAEMARQLFLDLGKAPKLEDILKPFEPSPGGGMRPPKYPPP